MTRVTRAIALAVLALWGMAAMHCTLEALPGLGFLKTCCFVDEPSRGGDCDRDGCSDVERGACRAEDSTAAAPEPLLSCVALFIEIDRTADEQDALACALAEDPPGLPPPWQFTCRTALLPRAPTPART